MPFIGGQPSRHAYKTPFESVPVYRLAVYPASARSQIPEGQSSRSCRLRIAVPIGKTPASHCLRRKAAGGPLALSERSGPDDAMRQTVAGISLERGCNQIACGLLECLRLPRTPAKEFGSLDPPGAATSRPAVCFCGPLVEFRQAG